MSPKKRKRVFTNSESVSLDQYLKEVGRYKPLTREREFELAVRIREFNDQSAFEELVQANLRFVISVAKQYSNRGLSLADLINEGNIGMMKAVSHFDETRGVKFISYAVWWIRQGILIAIAEQSRSFRLPLNREQLVISVKEAIKSFGNRFHRTPTDEEICQELLGKARMDDIAEARMLMLPSKSLDAPVKPGSDQILMDTIADESISPEYFDDNDLRNLEKSLETLTTREEETIRLYHGLGGVGPLTLEEIGSRFNLTRERIRQIRDKGMRRLRKRMQMLRDGSPAGQTVGLQTRDRSSHNAQNGIAPVRQATSSVKRYHRGVQQEKRSFIIENYRLRPEILDVLNEIGVLKTALQLYYGNEGALPAVDMSHVAERMNISLSSAKRYIATAEKIVYTHLRSSKT